MYKKQQQLQYIQNLAKSRNHQVLTENYQGIRSALTIYCLKHNQTTQTTYYKYKYAKWGCSCCAKIVWHQPRPKNVGEKISKAHKNKPKNYDVWLKGRIGKRHPTYKHGLGNLRAKSEKDRINLNLWKKSVLAQYNYTCFISGLKTNKQDPLVCHHLESWDNNVALRFNVSNGIVLKRSIHKQFHDVYGYGNNNKYQFEIFCLKYYKIKIKLKLNYLEPVFTLTEQQILTKKQLKVKQIQSLAKNRNHHVVINQTYSKLIIFCNKHKKIYHSTFTNYKKAKFGCNCCGYNRF